MTPASRRLWQPSPQQMANSAMHKFMHAAATQHGFAADYDALYEWSIQQPAQFWQRVWEFTEVRASAPCQQVLENPDKMPGANWFVGARLNFAENLLRYRDDRPALVCYRDGSDESRTLTYAQLYAEVARVSEFLRAQGVRAGDRVAGFVANSEHAVIAMLASASIGAIWSSTSPDFGVKSVLARFTQIQPKILFAIDGYAYQGKTFDLLAQVAAIAAELPALERLVLISFLPQSAQSEGQLKHRLPKSLAAKTTQFAQIPPTEAELRFAQLPFAHPLYILYSSGTTGAPKCIVHGAGGTLLQHLKEHRLHADLNRDDTLFYFTTCGWMMWNWLVSGLASGATLLLYDGAPLYPTPARLWQLAAQEKISVFGVSAKYIAALAKAGFSPKNELDLSRLRMILSTGSPLAAENFDYVYESIKSDVLLGSISGGTDIVSCFVLANPLRPVRRGEIQGSGLGMAVAVYSQDGEAVRGQRGELVCTQPFPSMPLGFWGDFDATRYHNAYFSRFAGVWAQGDFAEHTAADGFIIYGRSDAVLNPGGVRIGTAEIYACAEQVDEVLESICIGQRWRDDVRVVLFVVLRAGIHLSPQLEARIREVIQTHATRRHVPAKIIQVSDIPRTLSGKIVELAVRSVVHGEPVRNLDALANPQTLAQFRDLAELAED